MFSNFNSLQRFIWKGSNSQGQIISGELEALNKRFARALLQQQSISLLSLKRRYNFFQWMPFRYPVPYQQVTLFLKQFGILLNSGVSLTTAFRILAQYVQNKRLATVIESLQKTTQAGYLLSQAFERYPDLINPLHSQLIKIGEQIGRLTFLLGVIADQREKSAQLKSRILTFLIYPTLVIVLAIGVTILLLEWVIPSFSTLFAQFHAQLPLLTRVVIAVSQGIKKEGMMIISLLISVMVFFSFLKQFCTPFKKRMDHWILKIPLIRQPLQSLFLTRWTAHLSLSLAAGLPLLSAMKMSVQLTHNSFFQISIFSVMAAIEKGESLSIALNRIQWFPAPVIQMIAIGEESGQLEQLLSQAAEMYETELKRYTERIIKLLEPLTMSVLGVIIGTLVIALYLPIFKLGSFF